MQKTIKTASELRAQYGHGAAAMAEGLASARSAQNDPEGAQHWRQVVAEIRELERQEKPLLRRRG